MQESKLTATVSAMIKTAHMHRALVDNRVREMHIPSTHHRLLMYIIREGACPSQKQLAAHLGVTPAAVTGILKKLEADGYISRCLGADNRYNVIAVTEKGKQMAEQTREVFRKLDAQLLAGFEEGELDALIGAFGKMQNNIRQLQNAQDRAERKSNEKMV